MKALLGLNERHEIGGKPRGVAVDLGAALARKIGKPVQYVEYLASGAITGDADKGVWDVTFMPVDAERAKRVSFGAAYHVLTSTYLVMPDAPVKTMSWLRSCRVPWRVR